MLLAVFCCLDFSTVENAIYKENVATFVIFWNFMTPSTS